MRVSPSSRPHISDSGSVDISISSVSLAVSVIIGMSVIHTASASCCLHSLFPFCTGNDTQGHATLKTTGCSLNIGNLDVKFHGGASWLYNLFDSNIESSIKSSLQEQVSAWLGMSCFCPNNLVLNVSVSKRNRESSINNTHGWFKLLVQGELNC